jgi:multidrug efflux pump subunit AcrA (membrane-fusion protein)
MKGMLEPRQGPTYDALDLPGLESDGETLADLGPEVKEEPWWRRRWVVITAAVLLAIILLGVLLGVLRALRSGVTYQYQSAAVGNLALTVSATGPVQGGIYDVNFAGSGKIAEIDVKVGQQVTAGQTLAKLDMTSLQDAVNQAQAGADQAQTGLDNASTNQSKVQAETDAQVAAAYDQEQNALYACDHPTGQATPPPNCKQAAEDQFAAAQAQADAQNAAAAAQVSAAQAQLNTAQAQLQTAQHNLDNATLTAPHAGTVAVINGAVGGTPGAGGAAASSGATGASGGNVFIEIADLSSLQVVAAVNEADIGGVTSGEAAQFTVSAYGNRTFRGTVDAVSPIGQTASNVVTYPVTIDVDAQSLQGANLLPGMTATVTITTAQRFNVLLIPGSAVTFARNAANPNLNGFLTRSQVLSAINQARQLLTQLQNGGTDVSNDNPTPAYVLERAKGRWVVKPVVLGLTDGTSYEVLAGLTVGERVVVGTQGGPPSGGSGGGFKGFRFFGGGGGGVGK